MQKPKIKTQMNNAPVGIAWTRHRKLMRRFATVFLVIAAIGLFGVSMAALAASDQYSATEVLGGGIYAVLILLCALMAWNGSRTGAVLVFLVVATGLLDVARMGEPGVLVGLVRTGVYLILAGLLVWNAHRYHQESTIEDRPIGGNMIVRWGGLAVVLPLLGIVGAGLWMANNSVGSAVVTGPELTVEQYNWMLENEVLLTDEKVLYFYSEGIFSISEGGNLLTDKYVGSWSQDEGELASGWIKLGEVCQVELVEEGDLFSDAVYNLHRSGPDDWVQIWLSVEDEGHKSFISRLNYLNKQSMHPFVKAACDDDVVLDRQALALANGIDPGIVTDDKVTNEQRLWLRQNEFLTESEAILSFYSHGEYAIAEGGILLTDKYFGGWFHSDGKLGSSWTKLGEICSVERLEVEDTDITRRYKITFDEDDWYQFSLPSRKDGDAALIDRLKRLNQAARNIDDGDLCKRMVGVPEGSASVDIQE